MRQRLDYGSHEGTIRQGQWLLRCSRVHSRHRLRIIILMRGNLVTQRKKWVAWSSSCSRNAHDETVLVRCAQLRIDQATPQKKEIRDLENARSQGQPRPLLSREVE